MCVDFAKQMNVTQQSMQPGKRWIVAPAWYKQYCTAGAWKLWYHAARPVHAYNTVLTHQQQEKSNHQIHHGEITNDKTTINKKDKTTMLKLTRNKREQDSGRWEAERERKEGEKAWGRKWSWMWGLQNKQLWYHNGCKLDNAKLSYQHGTNGTVQWVHGSRCSMQPVQYVHTIR